MANITTTWGDDDVLSRLVKQWRREARGAITNANTTGNSLAREWQLSRAEAYRRRLNDEIDALAGGDGK